MNAIGISPDNPGLESGFREFHRYLADPSPSETKYQIAVQNLKTANYQYAKRQVSWIRNKLLPAIRASKPTEGARDVEMYLLDSTGWHFISSSFCVGGSRRRVSLHVHRTSKMDIRRKRRGKRVNGRLAASLVGLHFFLGERMNNNRPLSRTAFLRCDPPLPDPLTLSPAAQRMLAVPKKATE